MFVANLFQLFVSAMKGKRNERRRLEPPVDFCDLIYADDLAIMLACHYVGCLAEEA